MTISTDYMLGLCVFVVFWFCVILIVGGLWNPRPKKLNYRYMIFYSTINNQKNAAIGYGRQEINSGERIEDTQQLKIMEGKLEALPELDGAKVCVTNFVLLKKERI